MRSGCVPAWFSRWGLLIICGSVALGNMSLLMCITQVKCRASDVQWLSFCAATPVCVCGVLLIQQMESSLVTGKIKKESANYLLFERKTRHLCCYGFYMFFTCFWVDIASVRLLLRIPHVSKWCTLWECLLCAVTCCRILCMKFVRASKTRNWWSC